MIDVYSTATPNGHKVHIMLEETGLPYRVHHIDIGAGDQFKPAFLAISPNNKIPAIVDADGIDGKPMSMFESGAILLYLASKTGMFLGQTDREGADRDATVIECLEELFETQTLFSQKVRRRDTALVEGQAMGVGRVPAQLVVGRLDDESRCA